jgi:hypothetical protein
MDTTAQMVALSASALVSTVLGALIVGVRHRRRAAAQRQAEQEAAYDAAVAGFRAAAATGRRRRVQLVELLEVAFAGRTDRALTSAGSAEVDASVSRLYLDLALAGDDHVRREGVLRMVRRGISDIDMLLPEVPVPPAPQPRLARSARRRAGQWQDARSAELEPLRALVAVDEHRAAEPGEAGAASNRPVPAQKAPTGHLFGTDLAIAS